MWQAICVKWFRQFKLHNCNSFISVDCIDWLKLPELEGVVVIWIAWMPPCNYVFDWLPCCKDSSVNWALGLSVLGSCIPYFSFDGHLHLMKIFLKNLPATMSGFSFSWLNCIQPPIVFRFQRSIRTKVAVSDENEKVQLSDFNVMMALGFKPLNNLTQRLYRHWLGGGTRWNLYVRMR